MEDTQRTRDACLKLLDRWSINFYPERMDLFERMQLMATELGGQLSPPRLRAKYLWLQNIFGWRFANKAQHSLRFYRSLAEREWERLQFLLKPEKRMRR
jgi:hypothetical protein